MQPRRLLRAALAGLSMAAVVPAAQAATTSTSSVLFGIVDGRLLGATQSQIDAALNQDASLGVTAIREQFSWNAIEPQSGVYNWAPYDQVVNSVAAHHMALLVVLDFTPAWARPAGCGSWRCAPADPGQFAAFAAAAAGRYGSAVRAWEIWNEPNSDGFWAPKPDPAAYGRLVQATAPAIRAADPGAYVISGGLAPEPDNGSDINPVHFLQQLCPTGALGSVDAVGMHPYSAPVMPNYPAGWNAWQQMADTPTSLRSVMSACGVASEPIWITEYGAPTGGLGSPTSLGQVRSAAHPNQVSQQQQASMISQAVSDVKSYSWAGAFFVFSSQDTAPHLGTRQNFYGLRRSDGTPKPAWGAYQSAISG